MQKCERLELGEYSNIKSRTIPHSIAVGTSDEASIVILTARARPPGHIAHSAGSITTIPTMLKTARTIEVITPEGAKAGSAKLPDAPIACALGGAGNKTLFVLAGASLLSVEIKKSDPPRMARR